LPAKNYLYFHFLKFVVIENGQKLALNSISWPYRDTHAASSVSKEFLTYFTTFQIFARLSRSRAVSRTQSWWYSCLMERAV
jgi:hypothetical protein